MPFAINPAARDRWLPAMRGRCVHGPTTHFAARLLHYFAMAAEAMRNREQWPRWQADNVASVAG